MPLTPVKNPRKAFNFLVEIVGLAFIPPFGVQEFTSPDMEIDDVEHGFGNTVLHTGGLVKPGTLKLSRIISLSAESVNIKESEGFYIWQQMVQDGRSQIGGDPDDYKYPVVIKEIGPGGFGITPNQDPAVVSTFTALGAWPFKINGREYKRGESKNLVETIELKIDYFFPGHDTTKL